MAIDARLSTVQTGYSPVIAVGAWLAIVLPPPGPSLGRWLEATMAGHVLVEIPLLVAVGVALGRWVETRCDCRLPRSCNAGGIPGILIAMFSLAFWMVPRWLDAALMDPLVATAKYVSLPLLVGVPLAWSWSRMHPVTRGVVKIECLAMLFRLGWFYLASPDRLCNNYLLDDQARLGQGLVASGVALAIAWLVPVFFDMRPASTVSPSPSVTPPACGQSPRGAPPGKQL